MIDKATLAAWIKRAQQVEDARSEAFQLYNQLYELAAKHDKKLAVALAHNAAGEIGLCASRLSLLRESMEKVMRDSGREG